MKGHNSGETESRGSRKAKHDLTDPNSFSEGIKLSDLISGKSANNGESSELDMEELAERFLEESERLVQGNADVSEEYQPRSAEFSEAAPEAGSGFAAEDTVSPYVGEDAAAAYGGEDTASPYVGEDAAAAYEREDPVSAFIGEEAASIFGREDAISAFIGKNSASASAGEDDLSAFDVQKFAIAFDTEVAATQPDVDSVASAADEDAAASQSGVDSVASAADEEIAASPSDVESESADTTADKADTASLPDASSVDTAAEAVVAATQPDVDSVASAADAETAASFSDVESESVDSMVDEADTVSLPDASSVDTVAEAVVAASQTDVELVDTVTDEEIAASVRDVLSADTAADEADNPSTSAGKESGSVFSTTPGDSSPAVESSVLKSAAENAASKPSPESIDTASVTEHLFSDTEEAEPSPVPVFNTEEAEPSPVPVFDTEEVEPSPVPVFNTEEAESSPVSVTQDGAPEWIDKHEASAAKGAAANIRMNTLPCSLSIADSDGLAVTLLEAGVRLPARAEKIFMAPYDTPPAVRIKLYAGNRLFEKDNTLLLKTKLSGIAAYGGRTKIIVEITANEEGVLNVRMTDAGSSKTKQITITPPWQDIAKYQSDEPVSQDDEGLKERYLALQRARSVCFYSERRLKTDSKTMDPTAKSELKEALK